MRRLFLYLGFFVSLSLTSFSAEARLAPADDVAAGSLAERVQQFLKLEGVELLPFEQLNGWFPPDIEQMAADKTADFQEILEEYKALKLNMKDFTGVERIKRSLTTGALDFAIEPCDLDGDGAVDAMIQDNRGLVFFFAGKGGEPVAAMQAPLMSSTEEDMNPTESVTENIAARMKFSVEDNCLYLGYEPNSGAISCFRFKDGRLFEDLEAMEPGEP